MVRASRDRVAGPARCLSVEWETGGGECGGTARRDKARASQVTAVAVKTIYVSKGGIGGQIIAPVHCPHQKQEGAPSGISGLLGIQWLLKWTTSWTTGCGSNA
jgi:hypothetical protein